MAQIARLLEMAVEATLTPDVTSALSLIVSSELSFAVPSIHLATITCLSDCL